MVKYSDFKILTKIVSLLCVLAVVTIGVVVFSTSRMSYIDNTYGDLLDGPERANLAIARANRDPVYVDRSIYHLRHRQNN
ncbi:MAG: hypothetical protein JO126_00180 [Alphaproteobacteria bacterium]|nr:hypothetical protein [Alphaproteobacteria bacterium]MBV8547859.1 hypothetical protein [Alphaproteobacteria bacterium]